MKHIKLGIFISIMVATMALLQQHIRAVIVELPPEPVVITEHQGNNVSVELPDPEPTATPNPYPEPGPIVYPPPYVQPTPYCEEYWYQGVYMGGICYQYPP